MNIVAQATFIGWTWPDFTILLTDRRLNLALVQGNHWETLFGRLWTPLTKSGSCGEIPSILVGKIASHTDGNLNTALQSVTYVWKCMKENDW